MVKNLPASAGDIEMHVQSLVWEDPVKEGMATNSSITAWRIPWSAEAGGLQFIESQRVGQEGNDLAHKYTGKEHYKKQ